MRGEYCGMTFLAALPSGSSPHAWGILLHHPPPTNPPRFIPTCVGNTLAVKAHQGHVAGSSPHAWGIPRTATPRCPSFRFIPTCVGNTLPPLARGATGAVHPHMRGEYRKIVDGIPGIRGSSPHAWGIHSPAAASDCMPRFIPTCVGNTFPTTPQIFPISVHPHMRGEYQSTGSHAEDRGGSSPHAWGIHFFLSSSSYISRFIPTCVGNTPKVQFHFRIYAVHPHMRGEYRVYHPSCVDRPGSSPHAWGILPHGLHADPLFRFIPTCVGNTTRQAAHRSSLSVHPHMRGEYSSRKHEEFSMVIIAAKIYRSGTA